MGVGQNQMKTLSLSWQRILLALAVLGSAGNGLRAQSLPNPTFVSRVTIETRGGITYATYDTKVGICSRTQVWPVNRSGTNLVQYIDAIEESVFCVDCLPCSHDERCVSILGQLPPGVYDLRVTSCFNGGLFTNLLVRVPTNREPTLRAFRGDRFTPPRVEVAGIWGPTYYLLASSNLVNWTNVWVNGGAPFTYREWQGGAVTNWPIRFYRVVVAAPPYAIDFPQ